VQEKILGLWPQMPRPVIRAPRPACHTRLSLNHK
jgi:hypothetical protein